MAVQKKKSSVNESKVFNWTPQRKAAALALSTGTKTQREVCKELHVTEKTMCEWKKFPAFLEEVDRLTLKNENFTRAGLLKECLKGLTLKMGNIEEDRSTHLDYIKMIAELQGHTKQKIELDANLKHSGEVNLHALSDEDLMDIIKNDSKK